jgi:hypothetical protein
LAAGVSAFAQVAEDRNLINAEAMVRPNAAQSVRRITDRGLSGTEVRIPSEKFSGAIEKRIGPLPAGLQGSPQMKQAKTPDGQGYTNVVTISDAKTADFVDSLAIHQPLQATKPRADASTVTDFRAQLIAPLGSVPLPPVQTFSWTTGSGASEYYLWVGSCYHCTDLVAEDQGLKLSRTVDLPNDGRIVYVTLFTYIQGYWYYIDYSFYTLDAAVPSYMASPVNGATIGSPQTFNWTTGSKVTAHYLWIGSCQDCDDILNEYEGLNTSRTTTLPVDGRTIFVTLFSYIANNWYYYDYQFHGGTESSVKVVVTNNLGYPLDIFVNGSAVGSVNAFSKQYANVNVASLLVSFQMERPNLGGNALGDQFSGYFAQINNASGTYNFVVNNIIGTDWFFLPEITNQTSSALALEVNGGLQAQNKCGCEAPVHSTNVAAGYYRLYSNSNVRGYYPANNYTGPYVFWGEDSTGAVSPGGLLYLSTEANSGIIHLTANSLP